jgi:hypothetical protein
MAANLFGVAQALNAKPSDQRRGNSRQLLEGA